MSDKQPQTESDSESEYDPNRCLVCRCNIAGEPVLCKQSNKIPHPTCYQCAVDWYDHRKAADQSNRSTCPKCRGPVKFFGPNFSDAEEGEIPIIAAPESSDTDAHSDTGIGNIGTRTRRRFRSDPPYLSDAELDYLDEIRENDDQDRITELQRLNRQRFLRLYYELDRLNNAWNLNNPPFLPQGMTPSSDTITESESEQSSPTIVISDTTPIPLIQSDNDTIVISDSSTPYSERSYGHINHYDLEPVQLSHSSTDPTPIFLPDTQNYRNFTTTGAPRYKVPINIPRPQPPSILGRRRRTVNFAITQPGYGADIESGDSDQDEEESKIETTFKTKK